MPPHTSSSSETSQAWSSSASAPPAPPAQKAKEPDFVTWIRRAWERITEGLELSQLWKQFKADAQSSYRFYQRDFDARSPHEGRRKDVLHTIQEFAWAILEKLSPARRLLLLIALVILLFGGISFHFTDNRGHPQGIEADFRFYGGALLFVLLMLEVADRVVMKRDLEIARDIQSWLLPAQPPQVPGIETAFATRPANTVAGDYYDVFARPVAGEGHFVIAVADVAGKSIPAALLMATFQASLKTLAATPCALEELTAGLNRYACNNSQEGLRFTTAFLAEYEAGSRTLRYINAGHNAPVLRRVSGAVERLDRGGLPLGIQPEASYEIGTAVLQPGDWLAIFTDGLVEAENSARQEFGEQPLLGILQTGSATSPAEMLRQVMASLDRFVGETPQHDDVTCLLIKVVS